MRSKVKGSWDQPMECDQGGSNESNDYSANKVPQKSLLENWMKRDFFKKLFISLSLLQWIRLKLSKYIP